MSDMPTVYQCDHPKAHKEHRCCECLGFIRIGETYHKHHGIWDGEAETFKVCNDCESLRADLDKDIRDVEERSALGLLSDSIFDSGEGKLIKRYIGIKRKRGATIRPEMAEMEADLSEPQPDKSAL